MLADEVSIDVVTGFLGSGKTTLLRHVLENGLEGRRVAVVMNELGDIGVEGKIIEGLNVEQMIELGSGCVCCTINRAFGLALQEIVETVSPELIIVETTGVAEPANLIYETKQVGFNVDATITVVDAAEFERHRAISAVTNEQVAAADFVVLNKMDLVSEERAKGVEEAIRHLNPRALIVQATRGQLPADFLFGTAPRSHLERKIINGSPSHLDRDQISSFVYESQSPLDREAFERFLASLPDSVIRAKGLVRFTESEWSALFNFTCGRFDIEWRDRVGTDFCSKAVFIGSNARDLKPLIVKQLDEIAVPEGYPCRAPDGAL